MNGTIKLPDQYNTGISLAPSDFKNHLNKLSKGFSTEITGEYLLNSSPEEIPFLVYPLFQRSGLACLAGSSDTGKSTLLRQLAISIVTRQKGFLGFELRPSHYSVIYVSTEDSEREVGFLLSKQTQDYQNEDFRHLRFVFDAEDLFAKLEWSLSNSPADAVIIDCFADIFNGDLKDSQKIRSFLNQYHILAQKYDCLMLFLHHTGKRTEILEPSKNHLLSGQGFEAKMRLVIELRSDLLNPNKKHMCIVKGNYLAASHKRDSYSLEFDERTLTFFHSGERVPFGLLAKHPESGANKSKYELAKSLKDQGLTYDQIACKIGYNSKGSVAKLFEKAQRFGWVDVESNEVPNVSTEKKRR